MNSPLKFNQLHLPTFTTPVSSPLRIEIDQYTQNLHHCYPMIDFPEFKPRKNATPKSMQGAFENYKFSCELMINCQKQLNTGVIVAPQEENHVHFFEPVEISKVLPLPARIESPEKPGEPFSIQIPIEEPKEDMLRDDIAKLERELASFKTLTAGHMIVQSEFQNKLEKIESQCDHGFLHQRNDELEKRITAIEERNKKLDEKYPDSDDEGEKLTPDNINYFNVVDLSVNDLIDFDLSKMHKTCKAKLVLDLEDIISKLKLEN